MIVGTITFVFHSLRVNDLWNFIRCIPGYFGVQEILVWYIMLYYILSSYVCKMVCSIFHFRGVE